MGELLTRRGKGKRLGTSNVSPSNSLRQRASNAHRMMEMSWTQRRKEGILL